MAKPRMITLEQYHDAENRRLGYCLQCGAAKDCCEPDARRTKCDGCGRLQVYGPHCWLMMRRIT